MNASDFIVDVSEANFEYEVIAYSQKTPVVVDFWAEWCAPCRMVGPILEKLITERQGEFRLAKVNVDENPNLARRYNVRSIPLIKGFRNGEVVAEILGAHPEPRLRAFLKELSPGKEDLALEKAQNLLQSHQWNRAEVLFREVHEVSPEDPRALLGLIKSMLMQGRGREAQQVLRSFPASREYSVAEKLQPLAEAMSRLEGNPNLSDDASEAAYQNSLRLVARGNLLAALDGIFDILRQDKRYRDGEAHRVALALLELLGEGEPLTKQYRSELASILF